MKNSIILTCLTLLFNFTAFGQNEKYRTTSNSELELFKDLILSLKDSSFAISPFIETKIDLSMYPFKHLTNKSGFLKYQFRNKEKAKFLIKRNSYFEVANPDSIIKFSGYGLKIMKIDSTYIAYPYYYFLEKTYHKKCICTFSKTVFSKDRTFAIAEYFITCGPDDGRGKTVVLKKEKKKWVIIDDLAISGS
jgi:hypothetical protein